MPEVGTIRKSSKPLKKNLTKMVIPPTQEPGKVVYGSLFPMWVAQTGDVPVAISVDTDIPATWKCEYCEHDATDVPPCEFHPNLCGECCDDCWCCPSCENVKNGDNDSSCSACDNCSNCCECSTCNVCGWTGNSESFCFECEKCESDCNCNCDCGECNPEGHSYCGKEGCTCGGARFGDRERPLRIEVGVRQDRFVDFELFRSVEPAQSMADFYLLSYMEHDSTFSEQSAAARDYQTALGAFIDAVKVRKQELVEKLDKVFRYYVDIAVGGEVRHHAAIRHVTGMSADRACAWSEWLTIREQVGPDALLEAADLFLEMHGGGYGGEKWALAARLLHDRETGKIPDWCFVDRVFTMQHNGGSLLNKVGWAPHEGGIHDAAFNLMRVIGAAHHAENTDFTILQLEASVEVLSMFRQWWALRNKVLIALGHRPMVFPRWQDKVQYGTRYVMTGQGFVTLTLKKWTPPKPKPKPKPVSPIDITAQVNWHNTTADFFTVKTLDNYNLLKTLKQ